jgi:hypothetical protein
MSDRYRKNIEKISDMVNDNHQKKIVVGDHSVGHHPNDGHKVGDKWTDLDGVKWEQKEGYRVKVSSLPSKGLADKCPDCESFIIKAWDKDVYKVNGRCYYCQIDFEAGLDKTRKFVGQKEDILRQFTGKEGAQKWESLSEKEKESVLESVLEGKDKYVISKIENYMEGFKKEQKLWEKETKEGNKKLFDKSVANAMANDNVEMSIKKNT